MKNLCLLILLILSLMMPLCHEPGTSWAQQCTETRVARLSPAMLGSVPAAAGPTYIVSQDFEGTGTPVESGVTWAKTGSGVDFDFASPALIGSQSLVCGYNSSDSGNAYVTFTGQGDVWVYLAVRFVNVPTADASFITLGDSSGVLQASAYTKAATKAVYLVFPGGETSSDSAATLTDNTTYYFWIHYIKGSVTPGNDAQGYLYFSATETRPASPDCSRTTANGTADVARVTISARSEATQHNIFDKVRVDDAEIGNSPQ